MTTNDITSIKNGGTQDIFYSPNQICPRPTMVKGKGIYLWDDEGNQYIDASSGPVTCNLGHANPAILKAINEQIQQLSFAFPSTARNELNLKLAQKLTQMAGKGFERALFVSGGSEAVDMAIKFCRQYRFATGEKNRYKLISCLPSYHGMNMGSLAVSGDPVFEDIFGDMITFSEKIPAMMSYRNKSSLNEEDHALHCAARLEQKILQLGESTVLAFIIEPVGGSSSGANAPPQCYFNEIRRICTKYGVFLIYDEVMSGVGRTGTFLTSHLWPEAQPDISVVAKGLGAGYVPLGAMLAPRKLVDQLSRLTGFNYAHTYNASPLACAVGCAVLDEIENNRLLDNTLKMGYYLKNKLLDLKQNSSVIGDVRGRGLLLSIEIVTSKKTRNSFPREKEILEYLRLIAMNNGLMIYGRRSNNGVYGDCILLAPPLNVTKTEIDIIIDKLTVSLVQFEKQFISCMPN